MVALFPCPVAVLLFLSIPAGHARQGVPTVERGPVDVPAHVLEVLQQIKAADKDQMAVSEEDGRFLRVMVVSRRRDAGARDRRG